MRRFLSTLLFFVLAAACLVFSGFVLQRTPEPPRTDPELLRAAAASQQVYAADAESELAAARAAKAREALVVKLTAQVDKLTAQLQEQEGLVARTQQERDAARAEAQAMRAERDAAQAALAAAQAAPPPP